MTGIYCIENTVNHKKYIGQAVDIEKRITGHKKHLLSNKHPNGHLQRAWNKYGENAFLFSVVEECEESKLSEREIFYIEKFCAFTNGYNQTLGGEGTRGCLHTEEYKAYMRKLFTGRTFSEETIRKMSEAKAGIQPQLTPNRAAGYKVVSVKLTGRTFSDEHKEHISQSKKGSKPWNKGKRLTDEEKERFGYFSKTCSEETKKKIGAANKGKKRSPEMIAKMSKKVACVETGEIFQSITAAANAYSVTIHAISNVLRGKTKTCKGFHWRYLEGGELS